MEIRFYKADIYLQVEIQFYTHYKNMKISIKYFFSKCDKIQRKLGIWSYLLKKYLMGNSSFLCSDPLNVTFSFCTVSPTYWIWNLSQVLKVDNIRAMTMTVKINGTSRNNAILRSFACRAKCLLSTYKIQLSFTSFRFTFI